MAPKIVTPSIALKSFTCPHCGAHADQTWFSVCCAALKKDTLPFFPDEDILKRFTEHAPKDADERAAHKKHVKIMKRMIAGEIFFEYTEFSEARYILHDVHVSQCYSCSGLTFWLNRNILWPTSEGQDIEMPEDMPDEIKPDFEEARRVLAISARSAAALLRLCIQKLCIHFKLPGKNLNEDIATLVKKGLDTKIQRALDVVRVIGNNAVHPGQMDLKDDRATAEMLFTLISKIVHDTITHPRELAAIYESLPAEALAAIEKRDAEKK